MLSPNKPKRDGSQWPVKERPCKGGCGVQIQYRLKPKSYCPACVEKHSSQSPRAIAVRRSRERRAQGLIGFPFKCAICGIDGIAKAPQNKWCEGCRPIARSEYDRRKNAKAGCVPFGTELECRNCGSPFIKAARRDFYCPPCSELSKADKLPAYTERKRAYFAKYGKERRASDPAYAIRGRMTANINNSLRDGKGGRSWEALLGYTLADLMAHLEKQFLPGMSWENRSEWHIDHRRPVSSFSFQSVDDPEFFECWQISNLQPLWATDNIKKSNKRTHLI